MLNAIKELINEKKTIMESTDLILEDDQLDDSIILGEEASEPEDTSEPIDDIEETSDNKDDEEVPFKDEKDKEEKDEENTTDEEENDLMDTSMDDGEDNEVPTDNGSNDSSEGDIMDSPVDNDPGDNSVPETDDILDQPADSAPEDSSDPFDDILSTEINLKTNTMSDILPTPPAHAADAVPSDDDDLMNQRIDSGFGSDSNTLPETNPTNLPVQEEDDFMDQSLDDTSDMGDNEVGVGTEEGEDIPIDDSSDGSMTEASSNKPNPSPKVVIKAITRDLSNKMKEVTSKIKSLVVKDKSAEKEFAEALGAIFKEMEKNGQITVRKLSDMKDKYGDDYDDYDDDDDDYDESVNFNDVDKFFSEKFDIKMLSSKYREVKKLEETSKKFIAEVNRTAQEFNNVLKDIMSAEESSKESNDMISMAKQLIQVQERYLKVATTRHAVIDKTNNILKNTKNNLSDKDMDKFIKDMDAIQRVTTMLTEKMNELSEKVDSIRSKMNKVKATTESVNLSNLFVEAITLGDEGSADSTLSDEDVPTETQEAPAEVSSDETPTETQETPSEETSSEQAPDEENSVTSAVKDKVAEAENNDEGTTPESQETAKSNEGSVEILKKLASLTKGIEEAKKAVMDKIK